jgi:hypothetical protein
MELPKNYHNLKVKPHFCLDCGETDPTKFYRARKTACWPCQQKRNKEHDAKNRAKNNEAYKNQLARDRIYAQRPEVKAKNNALRKIRRDANREEYNAYERKRYLRRKANGTLSSTQRPRTRRPSPMKPGICQYCNTKAKYLFHKRSKIVCKVCYSIISKYREYKKPRK